VNEKALDRNPYSLYSNRMTRPNRKGVENARSQLPALLAEAEKGRSTIITRHGRSIAAIVPVERVAGGQRQKSLLALAGSGKGLWGKHSAKTLRHLREEWDR
jgi:antitoxin (DNA-binding transcriptional repressor) of toxin-antitoxin stability system